MDSNFHMLDYIKNIYILSGEKLLAILINEFKDDLLELNRINLIVNDFNKNIDGLSIDVLIQEPSGILQIILLSNALYLELCEIPSFGRISILQTAFKDCIASLIFKLINKSEHQLKGLVDFLNGIADKCLSLNTDNIYILELPVGNSVPSALLQHIFEVKGKHAEIISAAINRNDSKIIGPTRAELINEKLEKLDLAHSTVVLVDEWLSGSNFNNITSILSKIKGLKLLPCAFTVAESYLASNFLRYKLAHEKLCTKMKIKSDGLIVELPELNSFNSAHKFIWAESDRLAGYRKLDFFGSIISTFIKTGNTLSENTTLLQETLSSAVNESTGINVDAIYETDLIKVINNSFQYFNANFAPNAKKAIGEIKITSSSSFDLELILSELIIKLETIDGYTESQPAINIIGYFMKNNIISPESRYYYKGQATTCLILEGNEKYLNDTFVKTIRERFF